MDAAGDVRRLRPFQVLMRDRSNVELKRNIAVIPMIAVGN